jgi:hypothetical protein
LGCPQASGEEALLGSLGCIFFQIFFFLLFKQRLSLVTKCLILKIIAKLLETGFAIHLYNLSKFSGIYASSIFKKFSTHENMELEMGGIGIPPRNYQP